MATRSDAGTVLPGARAVARHVRISPMKARRVVNLVRGLPARQALTVLRFAPQAASDQVYKVLASAIANAENNERLDPDALLVSEAFVDEGPTLKRFRPRAQGRAYRIRKRTCHITIAVESVVPATSGKRVLPTPVKAAKKATAAEVTETEAPAKATKAPAKKATGAEKSGAEKAPAKKAAKAAKAEEASTDEAKPAKAAKKAPAKKATESEKGTE